MYKFTDLQKFQYDKPFKWNFAAGVSGISGISILTRFRCDD